MTQQHVCGQCNKTFATEAEYLDHTCEATGFNPTQAEHLGEDFAAIQEAALKRGADRAGEKVHPAEAAAES